MKCPHELTFKIKMHQNKNVISIVYCDNNYPYFIQSLLLCTVKPFCKVTESKTGSSVK